MKKKERTMPAHVLILGCGRSGTSIFGEFFQQLSSYTYFSEPPYSDLKQCDYRGSIAIKVPTSSRQYPSTDGLSFPLEDLLTTIPKPLKIFWQVRHPLDAICSLKVGIANNWGHHPKPLDWKDWLGQPLILQCAHHWNYLNTVGYEKVANIATLSTFESAILDSEKFAKKVCELVNIDPELESEPIQNWCNRVQNTNNEKFVEAMTSRAYSRNNHQVKVGRWKENMTAKERALVLPIIQETASQFGYVL